MIGDKLVIENYHTERALELYTLLLPEIKRGFTISIAGESGSGKSELAFELKRVFSGHGLETGILQQDDYFVFPPYTNHEMRKKNIDQVGLYEVKLDFMDSNLRSFKRNEGPLYKPLVVFKEDRIAVEEMEIVNIDVLIAEGTYTSILNFIDKRIFIDRNYKETLEARKKRARDKFEPFIVEVLEREHRVISAHKDYADFVIHADFKSVKKIKSAKRKLKMEKEIKKA